LNLESEVTDLNHEICICVNRAFLFLSADCGVMQELNRSLPRLYQFH